MSEPVREYQRVSNVQAGMTWGLGDRIDAQVATDFWEGTGERSIFSYNHTKREYTRVGVQEANVSDKSNPPAARWLRELRDRLWTSEDTGYQVLDVVIHHALMDGADSEQREAALARTMELVKTVWDRSVSGTTEIGNYVEDHGGDPNHWNGVANWIYGIKPEEDELVERVARWAHAEARSRTTTVPVWEELLSHEREGWIKQARAAIEGEK